MRVGPWSKLSAEDWCFWTVVLEKTLESPLDCKEIQPIHSKGDQSWVFIGRTNAKAETPILWPPHAKSWLIGKVSDAGRDCGQEEKGMTEDEMAGWHHRLDGQEFEWTPGVGDGQGGLACCNSWGHKELDMTEQLNWTELNPKKSIDSINPYQTTNDIFHRTETNNFTIFMETQKTLNSQSNLKKEEWMWPNQPSYLLIFNRKIQIVSFFLN